MDVERTIEFILETQAKMAVESAGHDQRIAALERNLDRLIGVVEKMVESLTTLKETVSEEQRKTEEKFRELAEAQRQLAESQQHTDERLNALIDIVASRLNGPKQ